MLKNYLRIALRIFSRQKSFSIINILGLSIGMAAAILVMLLVFDEFSYDSYHSKKDRLYRVEQDQFYSKGEPFHVEVGPNGLSRIIQRKYPEVVDHCTFVRWENTFLMAYDNKTIKKGVQFADPGFFRMFDIEFVKGDTSTAFKSKYDLILTETAAFELFGKEDPIGKEISLTNKIAVTVKGVIKDQPENTVLQFKIMAPFELYCEIQGEDIENIGSNSHWSFVELAPKTDVKAFNAKIKHLFQEIKDPENETTLNIFPFHKIYLYAKWEGNKIQKIKLIGLIGLFILIIACINFMNLSTARSANRAKEVGLRKVSGAPRKKIILQFIGESTLMAFIAHILAMIICELVLPFYNQKLLVYKNLDIDYSDPKIIFSLLGLILITGIISGSYPAFFLSSFSPASVFKGGVSKGSKGGGFRKALVVFQFSLSIILIIATIVVSRQINHLQNKDMGLSPDQVVYFRMQGKFKGSHDLVRNEFSSLSGVESITFAPNLPFNLSSNGGGWSWEGKPEDIDPLVHQCVAGLDYLKTFDIKLLQGEYFSHKTINDTSAFYILINKKFAEVIGGDDVLGMQLKNWGRNIQVIGIVDDYNFKSADRPIEPMAMFYSPPHFYNAFIKLNTANFHSSVKEIETKLSNLNPDYNNKVHFLDQDFKNQYQSYKLLRSSFILFASLAIFISCLGLFALASFMTEQKNKEIGIRKALGGKNIHIVGIFSTEFSKWILISTLIGVPIGYFLMKKWLVDFPYKTELSWWIFAAAAGISLAISLLSVSFQSIRAARKNPVETLRYE